MKNLLIILTIFLGIKGAFASPTDLLSSHDMRVYNLKEMGLRDLSFTIEVDGQAKALNDLKSYGPISYLTYEVFWTYKGEVDIRVKGIQGEYQQLRASLKAPIYSVLEFIFPGKLVDSVNGYELSIVSNRKVKALDKEMLKSISEIYFNFAQNGQLTQIKSKMPIGTQILTPSYKSLPATKNRWLGHKYVKKSFFGPRTMVSETSIKHQKIDGFVLPQEITIQTTLENIDNEDKNQRVQKNAQVIRLTDFKVNADVAKGHFSKRKK